MRLRSIGLVLAFVLLASACGNDGGTATETAEQPSGTADADADGASADTPDGDGATQPGSTGSDTADADSDADGAAAAGDDGSPPDDDFGEIIGDPDDLLVDRGRLLTDDDIAFVAEVMATLSEV